MRYLFLLVFVSASLVVHAQEDEPPAQRRGSRIIDDTTKQVYGPRTSKYFFEEDVFLNHKTLYTIDTAKWNFHRFNYVHRYDNFIQDLGNMGTAARPVFEQVPDRIGVSPGFTAYDLYWDSEAIKYFDTKSPYSNLKIMWGGKGRSTTKVTFARNINPRWSFGFNFRTIFVDKQVQRQGKGDRNVRSTYYDLFTSYQTKDSTYTLFLNFRRNFQQTDEYGGVLVDEESYSYTDFFSQYAQPNLTEAESNDKRRSVHLFHQYKVGTALQFYHRADVYNQTNQFIDADPENDYYDYIEVDSADTEDQVYFKSFRNEVGIKGNLLKLFYNGYVASRNFEVDYKYLIEDELDFKTSGTELYLGGRMQLALGSWISVKGWAEWMLDDRYLIQGSIKTKWFEANVKRSVSTPTFLQQAYRGSHDMWINNFSNVQTNEVKGNLILDVKNFALYPGVRFSTYKNFIFFKDNEQSSGQRVLPQQSLGYQTWVTPEVTASLTFFKHVNLVTNVLYTNVLENAEDAIQLPKYFVNTQLAYSNIFFNSNFDFQVGVDVHWKSEYYAPGYDLVVQQFYTQKDFLVPSFPVVDLFLNTRIKRARVFFKYNNVLMLFNSYGNIPTPYYPGIKNLFDFGFDWSFYD